MTCPCAALKDLGEQLRAMRAKVEAVRELHRHVSHSALYPSDCGYCGVEWPCETIQLIETGGTK